MLPIETVRNSYLLQCNQKVVKIHRGYYKAVRRYEINLRVVKTIFYEIAQRMSKILFSPREDTIHIFKPPRNVLFTIL